MKIRFYVPTWLALGTMWCGMACSSGGQDASRAATTAADTLTAADSENYLARGRQVVQASGGTLMSTVQQAVQRGGVPEGIGYCNLAAIPLVDSLSRAQNVEIRRASNRYRNPVDVPTADEAPLVVAYEAAHARGEELQPLLVKTGNGVLYAHPIMVNASCLKCHGRVGEDIEAAHYTLIEEKYPEDKAVDYRAGDFRGIWSVRFRD